MRPIFTFSLVFLLLNLAFVQADIVAAPIKESYNMGESLDASASIFHSIDQLGFMRFTLRCDDSSLPYFMTPIELLGGFRSQVNAPTLRVSSSMKGSCFIEYELLNERSELIEKETSSSFIISDGLSIVLLGDPSDVIPGSTKKIEGIVKGNRGESVNADITLTFKEESFTTSTFNGKFIFLLQIKPNEKSGTHDLLINAIDKYGNSGDFSTIIGVQAIPTYLDISLRSDILNPLENVIYTTSLLDQAQDMMAESIQISIRDEEGISLFSGVSPSNQESSFLLGQFTKPGEYLMEAKSSSLSSTKTFIVNGLRKLSARLEGGDIVIENIGNIAIHDDLTLIAQNEAKTFTISKDPKLSPGESARITLSRELPSGTYDIYIPKSQLSQNEESPEIGRELIASSVSLVDSRSASKKVGSSINSITGRIIGADGAVVGNGWAAPSMLITLIIAISIYYSRGLWLDMLFKKK